MYRVDVLHVNTFSLHFIVCESRMYVIKSNYGLTLLRHVFDVSKTPGRQVIITVYIMLHLYSAYKRAIQNGKCFSTHVI